MLVVKAVKMLLKRTSEPPEAPASPETMARFFQDTLAQLVPVDASSDSEAPNSDARAVWVGNQTLRGPFC
jgi:hypothetical protein